MWMLVLGWFRSNPRNVWFIGGLVAVIAVLAFVYVKGRADNQKRVDAQVAVAEAAALKSDAKADTKSLEQATRDAEVRAAKEKELIDAVADVLDTVPDSVAVRAGCCELQQNGVSVADLPACRAADGGPPACSVH